MVKHVIFLLTMPESCKILNDDQENENLKRLAIHESLQPLNNRITNTRHCQRYLERLDRSALLLLTLVVEARERPLECGARVTHIERLLDGNVAPVGDLDESRHIGDGQEGTVVLRVDDHLALETWGQHQSTHPSANALRPMLITQKMCCLERLSRI